MHRNSHTDHVSAPCLRASARFKALQDMRLSVQVAMETLFRPRAALRARVAKFVAATPDLWRRRPAVPMLCMHCRTFVADKKPSKCVPRVLCPSCDLGERRVTGAAAVLGA